MLAALSSTPVRTLFLGKISSTVWILFAEFHNVNMVKEKKFLVGPGAAVFGGCMNGSSTFFEKLITFFTGDVWVSTASNKVGIVFSDKTHVSVEHHFFVIWVNTPINSLPLVLALNTTNVEFRSPTFLEKRLVILIVKLSLASSTSPETVES